VTCALTFDALAHLAVGDGCPACTHSPLVHTRESGCSVCIALDAAEAVRRG
jgi:hypothetical protein